MGKEKENSGPKKRRSGGGGKRNACCKDPYSIGSFLRSLRAAKFWLVNRTIGRICEVMRNEINENIG